MSEHFKGSFTQQEPIPDEGIAAALAVLRHGRLHRYNVVEGEVAEAALLERAIPDGALICTLDERGKLMSSPDFAKMLARWRDDGRGDAAFVIGGADGIDPALRARADASLSFGEMLWPHMLAQVMLTEQLYRAASILAGAPYHRV